MLQDESMFDVASLPLPIVHKDFEFLITANKAMQEADRRLMRLWGNLIEAQIVGVEADEPTIIEGAGKVDDDG